MGRSEELGTGLRNVYKYSKAYSGSENILFNEEDVFTVDVPLDNETESDRNVPENVPESRGKIILKLIKGNKTVSMGEMASILKVNVKTVKRELSKLKQEGILVRIGPAKGGHWEVSEE